MSDPRQRAQWAAFQGCDEWKALLDHLEEKAKEEAEFVESIDQNLPDEEVGRKYKMAIAKARHYREIADGLKVFVQTQIQE